VDTRETVEELLRRIAEGNPEEIAELYADEFAWMLDWPDGDYARTVPWIRSRSTRAGVADHFRLIAEHHVPEESSATVTAVLVDGTEAVVLGEFRNTAKPTGRRYTAAFALHLSVVDGRVTRHHVYEDSLAVARAFGAA
jgi:ketosteroid isomerase-like protein